MRPTAISADRANATMTVTWEDGHQTDYPFFDLAKACPCASCNEKRDALRAKGIDPIVGFKPQSSELAAIEPVGVYAINIVWQDGCRFGIYTWELLLDLEQQHPHWRRA
ncbi:MAG: gamma-butyrobetaine hydroxylase-like domain-containing protein [Candidatus Roseilinea sp.]|uniref:gamma-butyrobetaine hydroxylase-like domain-containing protein n=1 Tax=Candidatus Roseilinea sp. TaxID=2838777 RepID=UPI004049A936